MENNTRDEKYLQHTMLRKNVNMKQMQTQPQKLRYFTANDNTSVTSRYDSPDADLYIKQRQLY